MALMPFAAWWRQAWGSPLCLKHLQSDPSVPCGSIPLDYRIPGQTGGLPSAFATCLRCRPARDNLLSTYGGSERTSANATGLATATLVTGEPTVWIGASRRVCWLSAACVRVGSWPRDNALEGESASIDRAGALGDARFEQILAISLLRQAWCIHGRPEGLRDRASRPSRRLKLSSPRSAA